MNFVLNMAWREMRAAWHRLILFFLCIAIGVGSIVSLRSFTDLMKVAIGREVRALFGGDVRVGLNQAWKPETRAVLERYGRSPLVTGHTEILETQTMVRPAGDPDARPVIAQLMGIKDRFPLYGEIRLTAGPRYTHALLEDHGVLASPVLLHTLNLKVGDGIRIGGLEFTIRGEIERLPGSLMNFRPIPRVVLNLPDVEAAGLTGFGSQLRYGWLFRTQDGQDEALLSGLWNEFGTTRPNWLGSFRHQQGFLTETLERVEGFLGLVGLAIVILGGLGVSSVSRVFVQQKVKTIAILKCLGGENRRVLGAYLAQVLALSLIGSLLGLVFAAGISFAASRYAAGRLPFDFEPGLTWSAALQGVGVGVLVAMLFSLPSLLEIRKIKPILVLRQDAGGRRWFDWLRIGAGILILAGLLGVAVWQSGSLRNAGLFMTALVATALVLNLTAQILMRALRNVGYLRSFVLRQGVRSLYRPGNQTSAILFTVGIGALFTIAIRQHQVNLLNEYTLDLDAAAADIFLVDVQTDQRLEVEAAVARLGGEAMRLIPVIRSRVVGLKRSPTNPNRLTAEDARRRLGGEQNISYGFHLPETERLAAGKFWDPSPSAEPEISVEEEYSRRLRLAVGDRLVFDILGRRIEAKVTSIRRTERRLRPVSYLTRFNILFRPGTLEDTPQVLMGALKGPPPGERRGRFQREFVEQFLNVSMIDAFDTIAEVRKGIAEVSFAVTFVAGFVFLCGVLILGGSIAMTKFHRLQEAAILKTLGAERRVIIYITVIEYSVLGLLAGSIGSAAAIGLTWAISRYGMMISWQLVPSVNLTGMALTLLLVTVVGVLASWDVMTRKPLDILRSE